MIGQHIFVRCKNEQGNAGTWTAAVTDRIVEKDSIKNFLEPRSNMDESFAHRTLLKNNSVLRLYHLADGSAVVTRTYWVTDRLTDGRKGAYSCSYILTGEDAVRFNSDFSGAFTSSTFEDYDALVDRVKTGLVSINNDFNIFSHSESKFDPSVLKSAGFSKESFVQLMNGIYSALENKRQFAVVLPDEVRRAWEENGDNTVEKLAEQIMYLLPDFTRVSLGIVSHWSCQIKDKMIGDMHLVFVHPKSEEDVVLLKHDDTMILDLSFGKYTNAIPSIADDYFAFLWDNISDYEAIEAFWSQIKSKYKKLLRARSNSANSMQCLYSMECVINSSFASYDSTLNAFLLAAVEFSGAGKKVPAAEEFLHLAFEKLELGKSAVDSKVEDAVRTLVKADLEPTSHQTRAYETLFKACFDGTANKATVVSLCDEVTKEARNCEFFYNSYLSEIKSYQLEQMSVQLAEFLTGVFLRLTSVASNRSLLISTVAVMNDWIDKIIASDNSSLRGVFYDAFVEYLNGKSFNLELRRMAYDYIFKFEQTTEGQLREECTKMLFKEEKRIYKISNPTTQLEVMRLYANSFVDNISNILKMKKEVAYACYQRLYRLAFKGEPEIVNLALNTYKNVVKTCCDLAVSDKILPVLLTCQEEALLQIDGQTAMWDPVLVQNVLLRYELVNIEMFGEYSPSLQRISKLLKWYTKEDMNVYPVCWFYLNKTQFGDRQVIYSEFVSGELIENMFLHVLVMSDSGDLCKEIEEVLGYSHHNKFKLIATSKLLMSDLYQADSVWHSFEKWYDGSLFHEIQTLKASNTSTPEVVSKRFLQEYKTLEGIPEDGRHLKSCCKSILDRYANEYFSDCSVDTICDLPSDIIRSITSVITSPDFKEKNENTRNYKIISGFDAKCKDCTSLELHKIIISAYENEDDKQLIKKRVDFIIKNETESNNLRLLWLFSHWLKGNNPKDFPVEDYISSLGYGASSELEAGIMLVQMLNALASVKSPFESILGYSAMRYLNVKAMANPQLYTNQSFLKLCYNIRGRDYFKASGIARILNKISKNDNLRFNFSMFLKCLIGSVIVFCITALLGFVFALMSSTSTILTVSVGALLFIIIAVVDVLLLLKRNPKEQNRRVRRN